jgi:hypothetical protein
MAVNAENLQQSSYQNCIPELPKEIGCMTGCFEQFSPDFASSRQILVGFGMVSRKIFDDDPRPSRSDREGG